MTTGRPILAAIMALMLGPWMHGGAGIAATVHPIVAFNDLYDENRPDGYFLGASSGGQWLKAEDAAGLVPEGENYRLYALSGEGGQGVDSKPVKGEPPCGETWYVTLSTPPGRRSKVAVAGPWNAMPRPVKIATT